MQSKNQFYNRIVEAFCSEGFCYEDVRIEIPDGFLKTVKRDFDLIVFNNKAVVFFASVPNGVDNHGAVLVLRAALNSLINKFSVSLRSVIVCGANEHQYFFLNNFNDRLISFGNSDSEINSFFDLIKSELELRPDYYDYEMMRELGDKLVMSSSAKEHGKGKEKIRTIADGKVLIRKHGVWKEASDVDTDQAFMYAALGGMVGAHLFYLRKPFKGFFYLLTLGLLGVGWLFDSLEIMFGIYKDPDGRYLLPVSNKWYGLFLLAFGAIIYCFVSFVFSFLLKILFG